jgi:hypothetical protein
MKEVDEHGALSFIIVAHQFSIFEQLPLTSVRFWQSVIDCAIAFEIHGTIVRS